ncbi:hypothetical protein GE061_019614 [Apolygus lucorum]|uniref:Golgi phosphoprotein 3 n=1 Tax=Apolygus lucorum TaxID=248454 RepID=A0A6A4K6N4_APOLU|nr:hypothetical protein GE061_019614 [Apolygus lucorum]
MCSVHGSPEFKTSGMMYERSGLHKRFGNKDTSCNEELEQNEGRLAEDEPKLSLMEELLLVVMDPRGFVSIWNDHVSRALRGSILIELWLKGRLELEPAGMRRKCLSRRAVVVKSTSPTDDCMLNEALKLMNDGSTHTVPDWISYLAGETWNPLKLKYHMRLVRDRIFKELVERRILTTEKTNYWVVDIKTHPIKDISVQKKLFSKIKDALLDNYSNDVHRIDKRTLSLLMLAQYSGGIDDCLTGLPNDLLRVAMKRIQDLESTNFEAESKKVAPNDLHWAVFAALNDPFVVL